MYSRRSRRYSSRRGCRGSLLKHEQEGGKGGGLNGRDHEGNDLLLI